MKRRFQFLAAACWLATILPAIAQINPARRELIQLGYNQPQPFSRSTLSLSQLVQFNLDSTKRRLFDPGANLDRSRGLQTIIRNIFR